MEKIIVATLVCLFLAATSAWSQDDIELYNRGLKSSLAYKKIDYFTKAIQLNPNLAEAYEKRAIHYLTVVVIFKLTLPAQKKRD